MTHLSNGGRVERLPAVFDVAVIGCGMGGWAAVRAARQRGAHVAVFESGPIGGT